MIHQSSNGRNHPGRSGASCLAYLTIFTFFTSMAGARQYVGSATCRVCHHEAHDEWKQSLHAAIYRPVKPEYILPDFSGTVTIADPTNNIPIPPVTLTLNGGRTGPFTVSFLGQTYTIARICEEARASTEA